MKDQPVVLIAVLKELQHLLEHSRVLFLDDDDVCLKLFFHLGAMWNNHLVLDDLMWKEMNSNRGD